MKEKRTHLAETKKAAVALDVFNRRACIHFAQVLRKHDEYMRISKELNQPAPELIPVAYFNAVYFLLSQGKIEDRATLLLGTAEQIETLVSRVLRQQGFYDESGFWIEL